MPVLGQIDVDEAGDMEESNIDETPDAVRDPNR